jgi:hypothetical protein
MLGICVEPINTSIVYMRCQFEKIYRVKQYLMWLKVPQMNILIHTPCGKSPLLMPLPQSIGVDNMMDWKEIIQLILTFKIMDQTWTTLSNTRLCISQQQHYQVCTS